MVSTVQSFLLWPLFLPWVFSHQHLNFTLQIQLLSFVCLVASTKNHHHTLDLEKQTPLPTYQPTTAINVSVTPQTAEDCSVAQHCHKPTPHLA